MRLQVLPICEVNRKERSYYEMKLTVYKGFDRSFLESLQEKPLISGDVCFKKNVLLFDRSTRKELAKALLSLDEDESAWITYEEYSLISKRIDDAIEEDGLNLTIFRNNLYPDYYPIPFPISVELSDEITKMVNGDTTANASEQCQRYLAIYNTLSEVDGVYYGSFYNIEYEHVDEILVQDFYPCNLAIEDSQDISDYNVFINEDVDTYLRDLERINAINPKVIGLSSTDGEASKRIQRSLQAYCKAKNIRLIKFHEILPENISLENELISIAQNDIHIKGFTEFRKIKFYKNPDIDKNVIELSQAHIIEEIIRQTERSYDDSTGNNYRDIFITASTGAGKSVMFQIPAVYLAKKYNKLTIIIEPVKALMQDQKDKLNQSGYNRVEVFNSDLISQFEKEAVLERVKSGEVDLLYLSPETLLSYSIETIIGNRDIGLLIVDEAHIVTTWGVGFRPDYWYLGSYINRLRNQIQTAKGMKRKTYHFPICAFTATAVNGGIDDSVSDTIISLYMENPVKYIGYVRRDDIKFDIVHHAEGRKLPKPEYEESKVKVLNERIQQWLSANEKTIVYFPYASLAGDAAKGVRGFAGITVDKRIGTYTGRNINDLSAETFSEHKRLAFEGFRNGTTPIMFATKAFGMGVDVNDVKNIYHYAVSGNLCDYVQEIGRAARKDSLEGVAITDFFYNDMTYMKVLFGMSQIRQYQIKKVLEGIYDTYKSKKGSRNFMISPQSFTYIFNGKSEGDCINKLKTCLLMLEKDFFDKYNFKVLISRPQSVFTKAFVCIEKEHETEVLESMYGENIHFAEKGRYREVQPDGTMISDNGDIYTIDLKQIWEEFHQNISFPQFKYWYFNANSTSKNKIEIMPSVRKYIHPRQKISVEARGDNLLSDLRKLILSDFEYIADLLYENFRNKYFTTDEFAKLICEKYGMARSKIIANSLFELVDPNSKCVKRRYNETSEKTFYSITHGNLKEMMRKAINRSRIIHNLSVTNNSSSYSGFLNLASDETSNKALKLLSIFDYITYEIVGGEEPEIFIRLNDPNKIRSIIMGNTFYFNNYVSKARKKHERDLAILLKFFNQLTTDEERWNYIEDYFLGYNVLCGTDTKIVKTVKLNRSIDKEHSYPTNMYSNWSELTSFFDDNDQVIINHLAEQGIPIPEYLETTIKKSNEGNDILMSWPSKDTLICQQDTSDRTIEYFKSKGWHAYRICEVDYEKIKKELN